MTRRLGVCPLCKTWVTDYRTHRKGKVFKPIRYRGNWYHQSCIDNWNPPKGYCFFCRNPVRQRDGTPTHKGWLHKKCLREIKARRLGENAASNRTKLRKPTKSKVTKPAKFPKKRQIKKTEKSASPFKKLNVEKPHVEKLIVYGIQSLFPLGITASVFEYSSTYLSFKIADFLKEKLKVKDVLGETFLDLFFKIFQLVLSALLDIFSEPRKKDYSPKSDVDRYDEEIIRIINVAYERSIKLSEIYHTKYESTVFHFLKMTHGRILTKEDLALPSMKKSIKAEKIDAKFASEPYLLIESQVYSLEMPSGGIRYKNAEFIPLRGQNEIIKRIKKENRHHQTGIVRIKIPKRIVNKDDAFKYSDKLLNDYWTLLSFAAGHEIFFDNHKCYRISENEAKWMGSVSQSMFIGSPTNSGTRIRAEGLSRFLSVALPLLRDEKFLEDTKILRALHLFNGGGKASFAETRYMLSWISLEILANAYARKTNQELILLNEEWEKIGVGEKFHQFVKETLKIEESYKRAMLYKKCNSLKRMPIKETIYLLLEAYGMKDYRKEVDGFYEVRNDMMHAGEIDEPNIGDGIYMLTRLLEKIFTKMLNFYEDESLYYAIGREDLRAR